MTVSLRRSVLSWVEVRPEPHSLGLIGRKPIWPMTSIRDVPLRRATASSPLNQKAALVWSAWARMAALAEACARTKTSPAATVPVRLMVRPAVALPLKNICTLYPPAARSTGAPVPL